MTPRKLFGVVAGMAGICLIVGVQALPGRRRAARRRDRHRCRHHLLRRRARSSAAASRASIRWRRPPARCCAGAAILIPLSLWSSSPGRWRHRRIRVLALLGLAVFSTAAAFVIYFRLIQTLGSVGTTAQAYLRVPIGVAPGVLFLGESLTPTAWIGLACVVARRRRDDDPGAQVARPVPPERGPCCVESIVGILSASGFQSRGQGRRDRDDDTSAGAAIAGVVAGCSLIHGSSAQDSFPNRPIRIVIPYSAGQRRRRVRPHRRAEHGRRSGTARSSSNPNPAPTARSRPKTSRAPRPTATRGCW